MKGARGTWISSREIRSSTRCVPTPLSGVLPENELSPLSAGTPPFELTAVVLKWFCEAIPS